MFPATWPTSSSSCSSSSPFSFTPTVAFTTVPGCVGVGATAASTRPVCTASRCLLLDRKSVVPIRFTTMPWMRAFVARPTTCVPARREPIDAWPRIAWTTPLGVATSSIPCCLATTMPRMFAAPAPAGHRARAAVATQMIRRTPLSFTTISSRLYRPPGELVSYEKRADGPEKLAATSGPGHRGPGQLPPEPDEARLEGERNRELELLRVPPGGPHELTRPLCGLEPLTGPVGPEVLEPVDVDRRGLRPCRKHDEVAVPGLELLEHGEELVALRATLGAPDPLLGLAGRQLEPSDHLLLVLLRLRRALGD